MLLPQTLVQRADPRTALGYYWCLCCYLSKQNSKDGIHRGLHGAVFAETQPDSHPTRTRRVSAAEGCGFALYFVFQSSNALSCHPGQLSPCSPFPGSVGHHAHQQQDWSGGPWALHWVSWPGAQVFSPTFHQTQPSGHKVNLHVICHHLAQPGQGSRGQQSH